MWSIMWSLLSVKKKRGMSHAMPPVENTVTAAASLSREMQMTTTSQSMLCGNSTTDCCESLNDDSVS